MEVHWNTRFAFWYLNIAENDQALVSGAVLVPNARLLRNVASELGALVFVGAEATLDNLGEANSLVWADV